MKKTPVSYASISVDGKIITGEEVNDYILLVSIDNIQGENNHIYSTIMVRKDLVKSSKPKVILGDRFTLHTLPPTMAILTSTWCLRMTTESL